MRTKTRNARVMVRRQLLALCGVGLLLCASLVSLGVGGRKAAATTPPTVNFQARLMNAAGALAPDGNYNVEFKIYSVSSGGAALWIEDWLVSGSTYVRVANGYLTASLGTNTAFSTASIPWGQPLWLTMNIGGTASTPSWDGEMSPRLSLTSVPSALALTGNSGTNTATLRFASSIGQDTAVTLPDPGAATATVCYQNSTACGFAVGTSGSYIQNGTAVQSAAKFNIVSDVASSPVGKLQAAASATAPVLLVKGGATPGAGGDVLALQDSSANALFTVSATGTMTVIGGLSPDITTAASASGSSNGITVQPGSSGGASSNGAALTLKAGDASGTTSVTAGTVAIQGGNATGGSGTRNGGSVTIDGGTGANANGSVTIGGTNAAAINIGHGTITTAVTGALTVAGGAITLNQSSNNSTNINTGTSTGQVNIGNSAAGAISLQSGNALTIAATNFNLATNGVATLNGGQTADITTAGAATASTITVKPGTSSGASSNGAVLTLQGGDASGTTAATGGALSILGGNATGGSGTRNGGSVNIDAGTGANANGAITIGTTNATTVTLGRAAGTTTLQGTVNVSSLGAATGNSFTLCRDNTTTTLTACDSTNTTGKPFLQGGNNFGVTGVLGTQDSNNLQIITGNTSRATFDTSNNLYLGNGITAATPNNFSVLGTGSTTAGTIGGGLTIQGGAGASSTTGSAAGWVTIKGGNAGGTGNNAGGSVVLQGGTATGTGGSGSVIVKAQTDATNVFMVQTTLGSSAFIVDTQNNRVGIGLGGTTDPASTLEVNGTLRLSGSSFENYTTPLGGTVNTKLNIVNFDPGDSGQVVALGLPTSTVHSTSRVLSLFDGRNTAHQPTLAVFSQDQNSIIGLNWNGGSSIGRFESSGNITSGGTTATVALQSGDVAGGNGNSGDTYVRTGTTAGGTSSTTGAVYLLSGDGGGTNASSGNVTIDSGAKTGTGTTGIINVGVTNSASILVGRAAGTLTLQAGTTKLSSVGSATANSATLCRDTSTTNLTACDITNTTGKPFLQGGNSFGATGVLGTADANDLEIITGGTGASNIRAYFDQSNHLYLGNGTSSATPSNFGVLGTASTAAGTAGGNLSITGGAGATATTGSVGGQVTIQGGAGGGTGNNAGGQVTVQGGTAVNNGTGGLLQLLGGAAAAAGTNGGVTLDAGSGATTPNGAINIGTSNANSINIGSVGSTAKGTTIHIGDTSSTSNTQAIFLGSAAVNANNITTIQGGSGGVGSAAGIQLNSPNIGLIGTNPNISTTGANGLTIQTGGGGGLTLDTGTAGSGSVSLGSTNAATINIGASSTNGATIHIADNATAHAVTIGSTAGASSTTIQAGTGNLVLQTNSSSAAVQVRSNTNSATAFQVQNAALANELNVDTTDSNLILNPGGEVAFGTEWAGYQTGGSVSRTTTAGQFYSGVAAISVTTGTTNTAGGKNNIGVALTSGTQYVLSFWAKLSSGTMTDLQVGISKDGTTGTEQQCGSNLTLSTAAWTHFSCTVTPSASGTTSAYVFFRQANTGTSRTFFIDNVGLTATTNTTTPSVKIGGTGPTSILTLDQAAAGPITTGQSAYLGSIFYNTTTGHIQCYEDNGVGGSWSDCGKTNLQQAYSLSTGGTTPEIILDSTRNGVDIQDKTGGSLGNTVPLFSVRGVGTASTLGASLFTVNGAGQVGIKNGETTGTASLNYDLSFGQNSSATTRTIGVEAQATTATNGNALTISAGGGNTSGVGGQLTLQGGVGGNAAAGGAVSIQGGASGGGNTNGGTVTLQGGAKAGTGVNGVIQLSSATIFTTGSFSSGVSASITGIDNNSAIVATATASGLTFTVPALSAPSITTAGRVLYIINPSSGSNAFTLSGAGNSFTLNTGGTATLIWNGTAWSQAGVDGSTLQTAYNNSIGGSTPEIVLDSATHAAVDIQDTNGGIGSTAPLFSVRAGAASGLGNSLFNVTNGNGNTGNALVGIGTSGVASRTLDIAVNNTTINAPPLLVEQAGTGDSTLEVKNSTSATSYFFGLDNSTSNFSIASSASAASSPSTISRAQGTTGAGSFTAGGSTFSLAFGSNTAAGNLIVVESSWDSSSGQTTAVTCSDTQGDSFSTAFFENDTGNNQTLEVCYASNIKGGADTVRLTSTSAGGLLSVSIHEFSGVATASNPLDGVNGSIAASVAGTNATTSPSITTTQGGDLIFGTFYDDSASTSTITAGTSPLTFNGVTVVTNRSIDEYAVQSSASSVSATSTWGTGGLTSSLSAVLAFKAVTTLTDSFTSPLMTISQTGSTTHKTTVNSTTAFQIQNASSNNTLVADTTNNRIGIAMGNAELPSVDLSFGGGASRTIGINQNPSSGNGGSLTLQAGAANSTGTGGGLTLQGGAGAGSGQAGGTVTVNGGNAGASGNAQGGGFTVSGGTGAGTSSGGAISLTGGTGGATGAGGAITITGGTGGATSGAGGGVTVQGGTAKGATAGGTVTLQGGTAAATAGSNGGGISIVGAAGTATGTGGAGGAVTIQGGSAAGTGNNAGGGISLQLGAATGTGTQGTFQLQNGLGATQLTLDPTNTNANLNVAVNGGAEVSGTFSTNWPQHGTATITRDTTSGEFASGTAGVKAATSAAATQGVRNNVGTAMSASTTYVVSFSIKVSVALTTPNSSLSVVFSPDGTTSNNATCSTMSTNYGSINTSTFVKYTCSLTTTSTATTSSAYLAIFQNDSVSRNIFIDNLAIVAQNTSGTQDVGDLKVGGSTSQGLTLFTLDAFAATPFSGANASLAGSMYFDTTAGKIQCYDGSSWGACGAAPNGIITLTPEYTGAVLNGSGIGTMTSDFCANSAALTVGTLCGSNDARNFYKWTSPQSSLQEYDIYVSYKLPATFKNFVDDNTITLTARSDAAVAGNALVTYEVYKSTGSAITACGSETTVTTSDNTWQTVSINGNENTTCGFASGNNVIFKIRVKAKSNANAYVENLNFSYTNQ